jgi:hypothetical protein
MLRFFCTLLLSLSCFSVSAQQKRLITSRSMVDAAERLLKSEKDPKRRLEILYRWLSIREEYEQSQIAAAEASAEANRQYKTYKIETLNRLEEELKSFDPSQGLNLTPLIREVAFRHLEQKNYSSAQTYFERITPRIPTDDLAYGDTLLNLKLHDQALAAYRTASTDDKQLPVATYKMAWVFLQLSDFENSLASFDIALKMAGALSNQMKEEAFKDRIIPYLEVFKKEVFEEEDSLSFKSLAVQLKSDPTEQRKLLQDALTRLMDGFNNKDRIEISQQVFDFFKRETDDPTDMLLRVSPLWLKAYRSRLNHSEVEKILTSLPNREIDPSKASNLQAELNNSAGFYETLVGDLKEQPDPLAKSNLTLTYKKYFVMFPHDEDVDGLRVNYGRLLLEGGDASHCLTILQKRSKKVPEVESAAISLESKCELKELDQLYAKEHSDYFYSRLDRALLSTKLYLRPEIGIDAQIAFEGMTSMLIGALQKNLQSKDLRRMLESILAQYPYSKEDKMFRNLQLVSAELKFDDLVLSDAKAELKAEEFIRIFNSLHPSVALAKKALRSAVLLTDSSIGIERCQQIKSTYPEEMIPYTEVFNRCIKLAQEFLNLEAEESFLSLSPNSLKEADLINYHLIQVALDRPDGFKSLSKMKAPEARQILTLWEGKSEPRQKPPSAVVEMQSRVDEVVKTFRSVRFERLNLYVPERIKSTQYLDTLIVKLSKAEDSPLASAMLLNMRAHLSGSFFKWFSSLPNPPDLNAEEMKTYLQQKEEMLKPWKEAADRNSQECGEKALALVEEMEFSNFCSAEVHPATFTQMMESWESHRQMDPSQTPWSQSADTDLAKAFDRLLKAGKDSTIGPLKRKYFLFQALGLARDSKALQAKVYLELAKLNQTERYWLAASELDSNLAEPIEWLRSRTKNPFYLKLYSTQLELIASKKRFTPAQVEALEPKPSDAEL